MVSPEVRTATERKVKITIIIIKYKSESDSCNFIYVKVLICFISKCIFERVKVILKTIAVYMQSETTGASRSNGMVAVSSLSATSN